MTQKRNFWTQVWSSMNGAITFGGLSPFKDVTSSVELKGMDGRHFFAFEEDGIRKNYTSMNTPGATIMHTGEDLKKEEEAFVILAENGDIQLKAANGKIRIEGLDIEFVATGNAPEGVFWAKANETLKLDSKNVTIDGKQSTKIISTGLITIAGGLSTQIFTPFLEGVSAATVKKALPKPGTVNS